MGTALVIISDRAFAGEYPDLTGPVLLEYLTKRGHDLYFKLIPDIQGMIEDVLKQFASDKKINLILTSGGTGMTPSDVTPEATKAVIEKEVPGFGELMRSESAKVTESAWLSRATAGIVNDTLIVNLPGSPKGALENFKIIEGLFDHALKHLSGEGH